MSKESNSAVAFVDEPRRFEKEAATAISVEETYRRYAGHGNTDRPVQIYSYSDGPSEGKEPAAYWAPDGSCIVDGISTAYSKYLAGTGYSGIHDDAQLNGFILAHEDMHCRVSATKAPDTLDMSKMEEIELAGKFDTLVNESVSDSMAALIIARRDGPDAALKVLDNVQPMRNGAQGDVDHDTRATLDLLRRTITDEPHRYSTDERAFSSAIVIGVEGAAKGFSASLTPQERKYLASENFRLVLDSQASRFAEAVTAYRDGAHSAAAPKAVIVDMQKQSYSETKRDQAAAAGGQSRAPGSADEGQFGAERVREQIAQIHDRVVGGLDRQATAENPYAAGRRGTEVQLQDVRERFLESEKSGRSMRF